MKCYRVESGGWTVMVWRWTVMVWYLVGEMLQSGIRWVDCDGMEVDCNGVVSGG